MNANKIKRRRGEWASRRKKRRHARDVDDRFLQPDDGEGGLYIPHWLTRRIAERFYRNLDERILGRVEPIPQETVEPLIFEPRTLIANMRISDGLALLAEDVPEPKG